MSDYTQLTNFTAKDSLPSGDTNKIILGADHDLEYGAIETAIGTKANKISGGTDGNLVTRDANGDIQDSGLTTSQVNNSWVELYSLSSPQSLASAWQEDLIDANDYLTYKLFMTWTQNAASTLEGLLTISGTPDSSNVYERATSVLALTGTPGPTVTGTATYNSFFNSTLMAAGPLTGFAELRININPNNAQILFFDVEAQFGGFAMDQYIRYGGGSGNPDGLQFQADANTTLETLVVLGLRNG